MTEGEYTLNVKPMGLKTWREAKELCVSFKTIIDGKEKEFKGIIKDKDTIDSNSWQEG